MLAAQMAVVHVATMTFARRLAHEEEIGQVDSAERAFNKLTRTFAMQMKALRRYRSGAEQRVTLQHVSVAQGGQAIVGNVTQAPRKNGREKVTQEKAATPPPVRTECRANAKHGQMQGTRPTFSAAELKRVNGDHKRNTGTDAFQSPLRR
jgi:hypothetical protein